MVTAITYPGLSSRRRELGMSHAALAARSGVSMPTVKRILGGRIDEATFANVCAIAEALGLPVRVGSETMLDADAFLRAQARRKSEAIARLVQGTSALEDQAVDAAAHARLIERTYHELLAGPRRRLWEP